MAAIDAGANGPCYSVSAGWTSSLIGLGHAYHAIRHGAAEAMITGGAESLVDSPLTTGLLKRSGMFVESSEDPAAAMRPFDATRRGAVATEGAVMLVLETLDAARRRGVVPYAEVVGFASRYEPTATQRRCGWHSVMASCMQDALEQAGVSPEQIGYVNAYGSAQARTDAMETLAVKQVFGAASRDLWLSSTKGAAGHMLGASGSFEVAMTALSMKTGVVLPTANLRMRDPECDLDYMAGPARERRVEFALKNTFAETGHCGTVVLRSAA
jgi:3-oxoacyl-(acyl-carrier-protein) synthase